MDLRRGILAAVDNVVKNLKAQAKDISTKEEIHQVILLTYILCAARRVCVCVCVCVCACVCVCVCVCVRGMRKIFLIQMMDIQTSFHLLL